MPPTHERARADEGRKLGHAPEPFSLAALRATQRDAHLCFRCSHREVCGMARALDERLLVTISNCLAFEADDEPTIVVEIEPIDAAEVV